MAATILLFPACGEDPSTTADDTASSAGSSESSSPSSDAPTCDDVWQDGAKLPKPYRGCLDGDRVDKGHGLPCSSGQHLYSYDDHYYAVEGGVITDTGGPLNKSEKYLADAHRCLG
jgi:hypothetical protein